LIGSIIYNAYHLRQLHKQNKKTDATLALIVDNTTTKQQQLDERTNYEKINNT
jgi:hypothetical protein